MVREPLHAWLAKMPLGIALLADSGSKSGLVSLVELHRSALTGQRLFATDGTAKVLRETVDLPLQVVGSGPEGGDIAIANEVVQSRIDVLIFLQSGLDISAHASDIAALCRIAKMKNIIYAANLATADLVLRSISLARANQAK